MVTGSLRGNVLLNGSESLLRTRCFPVEHSRTPAAGVILGRRWSCWWPGDARAGVESDASAPRWLAQTRSRTAAAVRHIIIDEHVQSHELRFHILAPRTDLTDHERLTHSTRD